MNKVLVTGGLGFIGSHIVNRYVDMGWEVHCLDSVEETASRNRINDWSKVNFIKSRIENILPG